jgi:hypothetical protein
MSVLTDAVSVRTQYAKLNYYRLIAAKGRELAAAEATVTALALSPETNTTAALYPAVQAVTKAEHAVKALTKSYKRVFEEAFDPDHFDEVDVELVGGLKAHFVGLRGAFDTMASKTSVYNQAEVLDSCVCAAFHPYETFASK